MSKNNNILIWALLLVLAAASTWHGLNWQEGSAEHHGFFSLLPALFTLIVCFATRNVIFALFLGVVLGGLVSAEYNLINAFLIPSLGSTKYAQILLVYLWALGGLIGMWNKNGGALYFAKTIANRYVQSPRSAKVFTWIMGVIFHQGGTISTVLTGTTVKPVADREKISHEELAYIVDSTASPIATVIPFNAWPAYIAGLITLPSLSGIVTADKTAIDWFYAAIPFNFYGIIAVFFTLLFALDKMPWIGKRMAAAVERARNTGQLDSDDAQPMMAKELNTTKVPDYYKPGMADFAVPIGVLLGVSIIPWLAGQTQFIINIFPSIANQSPMVFEAFGLSVIASMITSGLRGMSLEDTFDGLLEGIKGVTVGAVILGLAVTLASVAEALGTSKYIIESTVGFLNTVPFILPTVLLIICMFVSFSIGSSWGTYAVVFPIALPLAFTLNPDPTFFALNFGAILGGAVFGDQCSPISDTTILSSMACGSDLMDHVLTQMPLALLAATISGILYMVLALTLV